MLDQEISTYLEKWQTLLSTCLELDLCGRLAGNRKPLLDEAQSLESEPLFPELALAEGYATAVAHLTGGQLPAEGTHRLPSPRQELGLLAAISALVSGRADERTIARQIARSRAASLPTEEDAPLFYAARLLGETLPELPLAPSPLASWLQTKGTPTPAAPLDGAVCDPGVPLVGWHSPSRSSTTTLSPNGFGSLLHEGIGICNYGPSLPPLGDLDHFGIDRVISTAQLAAHYGATTLSGQASIGKGWIEFTATYDPDGLTLWVEQLSPQTLLFNFFLKGTTCTVGDTPVAPLSHFKGGAQPILIEGERGGLTLNGKGPLEVIPLAGGEHFWGADYLAAFTLPPRGKALYRLA